MDHSIRRKERDSLSDTQARGYWTVVLDLGVLGTPSPDPDQVAIPRSSRFIHLP